MWLKERFYTRRYAKVYYYDVFEDYDKFKAVNSKGLSEISGAKDLLNKEIEEVKRHKILKELTEQNLVREIKRNVSYIWADKSILENAQKWLSIKDRCDKRRKYNEKDYYVLLSNSICEALNVNNITIYKITSCGYENYAYSIYFTIDEYDYNFDLTIPIIKNMTNENRQETLDGMLLFGYESDRGGWTMYWRSYNLRDFKSALVEITTSDKHKKHVSSKENP